MTQSIKKTKTPKSQAYKQYLRWEGTPPHQRSPRTIQEFADMYDLQPNDILEFQEKPTFVDDLAGATLQIAGESLPRLIHGLMTNLEKAPKSTDLQSLLKIIKDHGSTSTGISEFDFKAQLSNAQLRDIKEQIESILG